MSNDSTGGDSVVRIESSTFKVVAVPLVLGDGSMIGTLLVATNLNQRYADELKELSRAEIAIIGNEGLLATTLPTPIATEFEGSMARLSGPDGTVDLGGESTAFRELVQIGDAHVYELASIDASSRTCCTQTPLTDPTRLSNATNAPPPPSGAIPGNLM